MSALGRPYTGAALSLAGLGAIGLVAGAIVDPARTAFAYLTAWTYWASLALGALLLVMIHHLTGSTWFIVLRRRAELASTALPLLALLFLPLALALGHLYPWTHPATLAPHVRELVEAKAAYLNVPFFGVRAVLYLTVWALSAVLLSRWSEQQDRGDGLRLAVRQKRFSAAALPAVALALTFASFDWLMSLTPTWASSVFGVYVFAGCALAALALLILTTVASQRRGELLGVVTVSHYHGMGKLLFTFVVFWAYIAFFQFFIIWIANVPVEAAWYVTRGRGDWAFVSGLLVLGNFVLPFFLLLSRDLKRRPHRLAAVAFWLLAMHYVDLYWLVMPAASPGAARPYWVDAAAFIALGSAVVLQVSWRASRAEDVARGDPRFERSVRFETQ